MSLNVPAKYPYLAKLVCAYTGKPAGVRMVASGDRPPLYFAADAFDPGAFAPTSAELFRGLGTRNGIEGAARDGAELVCPYTGARMTIVHKPGLGFRAAGGFRPSQPLASAAALARMLMSRDGVVPPDAPKDVPRAVAAARREDTSPEEMPPQVSMDVAAEAAEALVKAVGAPVKTRVMVPDAPKKSRKG